LSSDILTCRCRHCGANFQYLRREAGSPAECPECRKPLTLPGNLQGIAGKRRGRVNHVSNLSLEIGGLLLMFWYPYGVIIGLILVAIGWWKARVWRCSNCEQIVSATSTRCPHCRSVFTSE
jgi:hypothetical protein